MPIDARVITLFGLPRLTEIRWLGKQRISLVTKDPDCIAEALVHPGVAGLDCYIVINELVDDVVSRRNMPIDTLYSPLVGQCVADSDIARHILLPFDFDPVRATGTAADPDQIALAVEMRDRLVEYLSRGGWPNPAGDVFSGNGRHTYFKTDLPNTREVQLTLHSLYAALAGQFDQPGVVKLDTSVRSPAQLMRLPGTFNYKAQRTCEILSASEDAALVTLENIRDVIDDHEEQGLPKLSAARIGEYTPERMESLLDFYSLDYAAPREISQGIMWILRPCPFNENHGATSPMVMITKAGWPKFKCKHNSCLELKWKDFRQQLFLQTGKWWCC